MVDDADRRTILRNIGGIAGAGALSGCIGDDTVNGVSNPSSQDHETGTQANRDQGIGVGVYNLGIWDTSIPPSVIPRQKGFFKEEGLDVSQADQRAG